MTPELWSALARVDATRQRVVLTDDPDDITELTAAATHLLAVLRPVTTTPPTHPDQVTARDFLAEARAYKRERDGDHDALGQLICAVEQYVDSDDAQPSERLAMLRAAGESARVVLAQPRHDDDPEAQP